MKTPRKTSDIWKAIDDKRLDIKMGILEWRQSFEGVKSAVEYIGLKIITTKEELDALEIPKDRNGIKNYGWRNIEVSRNDIVSKTRIQSVLNGGNSLKTDEEMQVVYKKQAAILSSAQPKGLHTSNNSEIKSIDDLDIMIGVSNYVYREHLIEYRLFDMAYCMINDNIGNGVFVADQIKCSKVGENGCVSFHDMNGFLTVKTMIAILENGSLTCIGKNQDNKVDVVWFLYGTDAINILKKFNMTQTFQPRLHLMRKTNNEFTIAMNNELFRFDVGQSESECNRLLIKRLEFIKKGNKYSLDFLNEDDSQIPGKDHRTEQKSFNMTRTACNTILIKVERRYTDAYGPVDFIINNISRVQDKIASKKFCNRHEGKLPYNPDDIDIFQLSDLVNQIVYAIPMRIINDELISSFFSVEKLMKTTVRLGVKWKESNKQFKHDLKTKEGILSYVKVCEEASQIPQLTDRSFYKNMIDDNKDKFGSLKQLSDKKNNVQVI